MPLTRPKREYTAEWLAHACYRYEETDEALYSIAGDLGIHSKTLQRLATIHGWKLRKDRPPRDLSPALKLEIAAREAVPAVAPSDAPSVADRLEAAVEVELRKVESLRGQLSKGARRSIEAERIARTLATLTETLFKVRRLRQPGGSQATDDDDLPSDADGFRINLAHRIDVFVRSRIDRSVSGGSEPAIEPPIEP
jgi:hypothetical protein